MTPRFPKNALLRCEALLNALTKTFQKLPEKEKLPPEMVLSIIANAAAKFAVEHGIDMKRYIELQGAMIGIEEDRQKGPDA